MREPLKFSKYIWTNSKYKSQYKFESVFMTNSHSCENLRLFSIQFSHVKVSINSHCENRIVNHIKSHAIPLLKIVEHVSPQTLMSWNGRALNPFMLGASPSSPLWACFGTLHNIMGKCLTIPHNTLESTKLHYNYRVLNFQRLFIIANTRWEIMLDIYVMPIGPRHFH